MLMRRAPSIPALLASITALAGLASSSAENWPCWRGPDRVGVSAETGLATEWSTEKNILWKLDDPGFGHSSPIVWGDALFLTTAVGEDRVLLRLDARTGTEVWRRTVLAAPLEEKHRKNSYASSTPATDGERVYLPFLGGERIVVVAFDFDGEEAWRVSPGEFHSRHGFCSSPLLFEDLVILNCDQDAYASIVALDRRTGTERWRTHRENEVRSYCPPVVVEVEGKPQMILAGSKTVCSYDPRDGKRIWVCDGPTEQCVASIVHGKGIVFVTGGYPERHILAIDPRGRGDVSATHVRWREERGVSYVPSPLYHDGHFYVVDDNGILSALEATSGRTAGRKRLDGDFSASLLYADGHIFAFSEKGVAFVFRAGPALELVREITMDAPIYATPAVSNGRIFLRTWETLWAIGKGS